MVKSQHEAATNTAVRSTANYEIFEFCTLGLMSCDNVALIAIAHHYFQIDSTYFLFALQDF